MKLPSSVMKKVAVLVLKDNTSVFRVNFYKCVTTSMKLNKHIVISDMKGIFQTVAFFL